MNREKSIIIALIGLAGVLGAAVIQNWNTFFQKSSTPIVTTSTTPTIAQNPSPIYSPTPVPSSPSPPSPTVEPSEDVIKSVIVTAYINKRNGLLTGNLSELQKSYTGEALKSLEAFVTGNATSGASAILINYDYNYTKFEDYKVIENNEKVKIRATSAAWWK